MTAKSKKVSKPAQIHTPDELRAMMSEDDIRWVKKRVRRKQGSCGVCHRKLGKTKPLALSFTPTNLDDLMTMAGTWHVLATHRWCKKEAIHDKPEHLPQQTYMTTLMALPVEQTTDAPRQVPTLVINPTVDHMMLHHDADGGWTDATVRLLEDTVGFGRMTKTNAKDPGETGLTAYVNNADVTVALIDHGLSWTHEQPEANAEAIAALTGSLHELIKAWDNTLLVMVSPKFKCWEPQQILADLPEMLHAGDVLAATANVEFRESNTHLVQKAMAAATGERANG